MSIKSKNYTVSEASDILGMYWFYGKFHQFLTLQTFFKTGLVHCGLWYRLLCTYYLDQVLSKPNLTLGSNLEKILAILAYHTIMYVRLNV